MIATVEYSRRHPVLELVLGGSEVGDRELSGDLVAVGVGSVEGVIADTFILTQLLVMGGSCLLYTSPSPRDS